MRKQLVMVVLVLSFICVFSQAASAGDYTSSDPNKNSNFQRIYAKQYLGDNVNVGLDVFNSYISDCTNFASQSIFAGGMPKITAYSSQAFRNWYFYSVPHYGIDTTTTWIRADDFRRHWGNVNNQGWNRAYEYKVLGTAKYLRTNSSAWNDLYDRCSAGDVIQFVYGQSSSKYGVTWHSLVVHRRSDPNGTKKISMAQHSSNAWKNLKVDSLNAVPDDTIVCLIRIKKVQDAIEY